MRSTENFARALICSSASRGIVPISAWTSQTAISTSSHFWNLVFSDQSAPISGKVYRSIITNYFADYADSNLAEKTYKEVQEVKKGASIAYTSGAFCQFYW